MAEHAREGLLIKDACHSNFNTGEQKRKVMELSNCTCGEYEDDSVSKLISDAKETIELKKPYISELPLPPDIYSALFERILSTGELSDRQGTMKTLPKVSMTDIISFEQETVV